MLGSFLAVACYLLPGRVGTSSDWVSGFAPFMFAVPTHQLQSLPCSGFRRPHQILVSPTLKILESSIPGMLELIWSTPSPSLAHGDGKLHAAEFMAPASYAWLTVGQSLELWWWWKEKKGREVRSSLPQGPHGPTEKTGLCPRTQSGYDPCSVGRHLSRVANSV